MELPPEPFDHESALAVLGTRARQRQPGTVELRLIASGDVGLDLRAHVAKQLTLDRARREDLRGYLRHVLSMLDERIGIAEPLDHDCRGLVGVEEDVVLQRSRLP